MSAVRLLSPFCRVDSDFRVDSATLPVQKIFLRASLTKLSRHCIQMGYLYRHRDDPHHRNDLRHRNDFQSPPKWSHHRNDTYSQSKWSRHKFLEPWLKWTWDFAIYSKFFVYSCKHDSKQRKIEKAIRLITVLYTDFIFKILTFF